MPRIAEELGRGSKLDQPAGAHHGDAIGEVVHHRQVVRDEDVGEVERLAQVEEQVQHLRLHRDVERRDRFIQQQQFRAQRERPRDADPLALAAGEAVRVAAQEPDIEADQRHHLLHALKALVRVADLVDHERLADDVVRRHARVERAEGVLEHKLHLAPVGEELGSFQAQHVFRHAVIVEYDRAGVRGDRAQDHARGGGLAAARLADQAEALARRDREAHVVDRDQLLLALAGEGALAHGEALGEVLHLQERAFVRRGIVFTRGNQVLVGDQHLADRREPLARRHVEARHRAHQRLQIGMLRLAEDVLDAAGFHHAAAVHHDHLGRHVGDHAEIVRDEQHRHAQFALQVADQLQDLRLDGDVERGGRLIGNQQRRAADQRRGDHRALAQPAGELERISALGFHRIGKAHQAQDLEHCSMTLRAADARAVQRQGLADLVADRVQRRERGHRLLEDDRDAAAADLAHLRPERVQAREIDHRAGPAGGNARIAKQDFAGFDARDARQDAHDALRDHRFARARLADQRHRAALRHAERHAVDRLHDAGVDVEIDLQVTDGKQVSHFSPSEAAEV